MIELVTINILLQIADAYTTILVIRRGGSELSPILIWLTLRLVTVTKARWAWLAVKTVLTSTIIFALWWFGERDGLIFLLGWYGSGVFANYLHYRRQG